MEWRHGEWCGMNWSQGMWIQVESRHVNLSRIKSSRTMFTSRKPMRRPLAKCSLEFSWVNKFIVKLSGVESSWVQLSQNESIGIELSWVDWVEFNGVEWSGVEMSKYKSIWVELSQVKLSRVSYIIAEYSSSLELRGVECGEWAWLLVYKWMERDG